LREGVERGFIRPETSRSRWIEMDGSRSPDRVSAQAGRNFPGPSCGPGVGRAERERAGGSVSVSGRTAAWHAERGLRLQGVSWPGARSEFCVSGPWAVFHFRAEFHSEQ
jgi:hypothetical protein